VSHPIFTRILPLFLLAAGPALAAERARETVIEDSPARLVLEVEAPSPILRDGPDGVEVQVPGFEQASAVGAPALPWYGFQVATGRRAPSVSIEALEWTEVALSKPLAGVPRWISTRESEPARDPALFAAAGGLAPRVSDLRTYRGMQLRRISLPIATHAEGSGRVRVLKKFRVTATFAGPSSAPAAGVRPWLVQADVKNPNGGQYLVSLPRRPLRRSTASALSSTTFLKIKVGDKILDALDEDGVYSLAYETAKLANPNILAAQIGKLRLYAGPNDVLQIPMGAIVGPTLAEIPIEVVDANADGTFNEGDRILFYAHGTSLWKPIAGATGPVRWEFAHDPYSYENYYYLDWNGAAGGARMDSTAYQAAPIVADAPHYVRAEKDLGPGSCDPSHYFDAEGGGTWYWLWKGPCPVGPGPGFASTTPTLTFAQLRSPSTDTLKQRAADSAIWFGGFTFWGGGIEFRPWMKGNPTELPYADLGIPGSWNSRTPAPGEDDLLGIDSVKWLADAAQRFEGYTIRYRRRLAWGGSPHRIFPAAAGQRVAYRIDSAGAATGLTVLRVEAGVARRKLSLQTSVSSVFFSDSVGLGEDVQYFVYQNPVAIAASALTSDGVSAISGVVQNLTTGDNKNPDYVIIAPKALLADALELRAYRDNVESSTRWNTVVVRTEDIYREWSGGRLSPIAIRDFLRWAMNRWGSGGPGNLKYVALYGDGHFDYRDIRNGASNAPAPNYIPPFNSQDGPNNPMNVEDFFAVLDSGEAWNGVNINLDLSIGRLPIQNSGDARNYLDKIRRYEDPATSGEWRSRLLLTADDAIQHGNGQPGEVDQITGHTNQTEEFGQRARQNDSGMRVEQVYLFDYDHNAAFLKPEATQDLLTQLNRGMLTFTFFGHGAYNQLADEVLLKTADGLSRLKNVDNPFTMAIFSCTVGRFDKLQDEGMTEQFWRMNRTGAIAALAAARESFPAENGRLGNNFALQLFSPRSDTVPQGIGEVVRRAKNALVEYDHRKYALLGEPVAVVHRPGLGVELDPVDTTLQALGCGVVKGRVRRGSGKGMVNVRIVSGDIRTEYPHGNVVMKRGQILFERTIPFTDSAFSVDYFLPKQIPFGDTAAKIQIFAWDADSLRESAVLVANRRISGTRGTCVVDSDGRGPRISVTGCNTKESGGVDFPDKVKIALPYCLQITVRDTIGGVLSGDGPDEGTTVEVVGSVAPYHPQAGVDDLYSKSYQLTLSNQDLTPGTHLLKVSARDGFGNLGTRQLSLEVSADTALRFIKAFNVPNPMKRAGTTFHFQTTLPVEEGAALESPRVDRINFHVRVFNQQGYMVQEFRNAVSGETRWDGKDAWGRQLANGVYFYQVTATWGESEGSPQGGRRTSRKQVLVISR
jgi:hypothetical protein